MTTARTLRASDLVLKYDDRTIVDGLNLTLPTSKVTVIVGANACGKSTLLRALARLLSPHSGVVHLDDHDLRELSSRKIAHMLGILSQSPIAPEGITVVDLVSRGRYPHQGAFRRWSAADDEAVASALESTGTSELADRPVDQLSGGQRQRVWIAMALAQQTDIMLLDEPTTYLDLAHQIDVLDLVAETNARTGATIAMVLHDLNLAARYADHVVAMCDGAIVAQGSPWDVFTADLMHEVFSLRCRVIADPESGTPLIIPAQSRPGALPQAGLAVAG